MHRHIALVIVVFVALGSPLLAQKPDADLQALVQRYEQAFNKGDANALAALHTTEAFRIGGDGEFVVGRAAIEKHLGSAFGGPAKGARLTLRPGRTQNVTADVRIMEGTYEVTGGSMGPLRGRYVNTAVRQDGQWRMASVVAVPEGGTQKPGMKPGTTGSK